MDFLENIWNQVRGADSSQHSPEEGGSQQSQRNQPHPSAGMQHDGNETLDPESGGKEIRTYRREGIDIIEEYERLNPDGTVTKTISIGDKKNGLKKFEVYKMDKSGIVRRIESASKGENVEPEAMRELWMNDFRMSDNLKERVENKHIVRSNTYDSSNNSKQSLNANQYLNSLTPEQRTSIYNQFKERLLTYGTNKFKNLMIPKLDSNGTELGLTNEDKIEILEAGLQKLRRRLNESINEEKFFTEVWPRYGMSKNSENYANDSSSTQVSFALQPNNTLKQSGSSGTKPISFVIRPEFGTPSGPQSRTKSAASQDKAFLNDIWEDKKVHKYQTKEFTTNEPKDIQNIEVMESMDDTIDKLQKHFKRHINADKSTNEKEKQVKVDSLDQTLQLIKENLKFINLKCENMNDDPLLKNILKRNNKNWTEESISDLIDKLHTFLKLSIKYDPSLNNKDKQMKNDFFGIALETLKNRVREGQNSMAEEHVNRKSVKIEESKPKEEKSKKNDFDDIDEVYDHGLKAFKKLFKKSLSGHKIKDEFSRYLKDQDNSSKRKRVKDDVTYESQRKIRNDDIYEEELERDMRKGFSSERNKPIDLWKSFFKKLDYTTSSNEREKRSLADSHSELKSRSLGRKESEYLNERSKDNNRYAQKCHPESTSETQSESQNDKRAIFDMRDILRKMRSLLDVDNEFDESYRKYNDNYNPQPRELEVNRQDDSHKVNRSGSNEYSKILSKLRESLSQRANKEIDSTPKQVRHSSPYSYLKPPHGTTKIKSLGTQQNQPSNISFRIQPQEYAKTNNSSSGIHQINNNKSYADEDKDIMPWWFGNAPHSNLIDKHVTKEPLIKAPVTNSFLGTIMNDSFFDNLLGNKFSTPQLSNY